MAQLHLEEHWREKCQRYVEGHTSATRADQPHSARSIIPPLKASSKYKVNQSKPKHNLPEIYIRKAFSLSSIHALPFIAFLNSRLGRIIWSLIIFIALGLLIYIIYAFTSTYLQNFKHLKISHSTNLDPVTPRLTICNNNIFRKSFIVGSRFTQLLFLEDSPMFNSSGSKSRDDKLPQTLDDLSTLKSYMMEKGINVPDAYISSLYPWFALYGINEKREYDWVWVHENLQKVDRPDLWVEFLQPSLEEISYLGHQLSEMIVKCTAGGETCQISDVQSIPHPKYGHCVAANFGAKNTDLSVVLDGEVGEYMGLFSDTTGVTAFVHSSDTTFHSTTPLQLQPNHKYQVQAQLSTYIHEEPCSAFSEEECKEACVHSATMDYCGCSTRAFESNVCDVFNPVESLCHKALLDMNNKGILSCNCNKQCRVSDYKIKHQSMVSWPSEVHLPHFVHQMSQNGRTLDANYVKSNYISLDIKILADGIEVKEEQDLPLLMLLANIGGISCLILGMSIVSILEFIFLLLYTCWQKWQAANRTGKNRVSHPVKNGFTPFNSNPNFVYPNNSGAALPPFKAKVMYLPSSPPMPANEQLSPGLPRIPAISKSSMMQNNRIVLNGNAQGQGQVKGQGKHAAAPAPKRTTCSSNNLSVDMLQAASKRKAPLPPLPARPQVPSADTNHQQREEDMASNNMYFEIEESRVIIQETNHHQVPPLELWESE